MRISLKRILTAMLSALCIATIFFSSLSISSSSQVAAASTSAATMTGDYVNLRSGAGTNYSIIGSLSSGELVTVLDDSNPDWVKVQTSNGAIGYCSKEFVKTLSSADESEELIGTLTGDYVNLRAGAGTGHAVIGMLYLNDEVTVLDDSDANWAKIRTKDGQEGYCSKEYLHITKKGETAQETAVTTDALNLRSGAGTDYHVKTVLSKGTTVTILDNSDVNWAKVRTADGTEGYCSKAYLDIAGSSAQEPSSPTQQPEQNESTSNTTELQAVLTGSDVNLRSGAGTGYSVIGSLYLGQRVTVINNSDANWAKIRTESGQEGYCTKEFLQISDGSGSNAGEEVSIGKAITTDYLNLRSGAGLNHNVLTVLAKGAVVDVIDNSDGTWVKVKTNDGTVGYCSKDYLQMEVAPTTVSLSETERTVTAGESFEFTATISDESLPTAVSTNAGAVQVTYLRQEGNTHIYQIQALQAGNAEIRISANGACASLQVTVDAAQQETQGQQATVNADYLNIRSGKGTDTSIIGGLTQGSVVTILDNSDANWVKIRTAGGIEGYVAREYLTGAETPSEPTTPETPSETTTATVNADVLNVRSGKGTDTSIVGTIRNGETVTVLDNSDAGWVKIKTASGLEGYVAREYLTGASNAGGGSSTVKYAQVTADVLNVRSGMGTEYSKIGSVSYGEIVEVLDDSNAGWAKIKTSSGLEGYVSKDYLGEVGENNVSNSVTIPAGKTYYAASSSGYWYSSNNSVATASNGYITAVAPGTCTITGSNGITYSITVTEGEAVRTAYASPNIAAVGETVEMVAVTDTTRDSVQFRIRQSDGTTKTVNAYDYTTEYCNGTTTRVWKASTTFSSAGTHQIEVYSTKNGVMSSTGYTTDAYTVWSTGANESSNETRRISDEMINLIASWEGYSSTVYPDNLAGGIPTIGYGQTFGTGVQFYNNMSKTEAWSLLVKSINAGSYTSEVNRFLQNNGIKATQSQFDALVSFSYNIGSGYWNGTSQMDLREIMLNAVVPPTIAAGTSLPASVTFQGARLYNSPSKSASVLRAVNNGTSVQVLEASYDSSIKSGWYKVQLSDGTVGYMCSGYVRFASSVSVTHDLNYVDAHAFGSEMLLWHHAGGNCYAGLVYRRMGEAKVFSYGDYASATPGNYEYQRNTYGYDIPDCIRGNGWIK